jgi:predicted RNA-binding Zn-ribbon protein involved in translation (DUF1610 family)
MADEIEYDCPDCGQHVIAFGFFGVAEPDKRCAECDWIRKHIPPAEQTAVRARLGVPLASYRISIDGKSITCLVCGFVSHNRNDVREVYCGNCHRFHRDPL